MSDTFEKFRDLQDAVACFLKDRGWHHPPKDLAMSVAIEAAELMEILQWTDSSDALNYCSDSHVRTRLAEELADVVIYCASFANVLGLDLGVIAADKLKKNGVKYPLSRN